MLAGLSSDVSTLDYLDSEGLLVTRSIPFEAGRNNLNLWVANVALLPCYTFQIHGGGRNEYRIAKDDATSFFTVRGRWSEIRSQIRLVRCQGQSISDCIGITERRDHTESRTI